MTWIVVVKSVAYPGYVHLKVLCTIIEVQQP